MELGLDEAAKPVGKEKLELGGFERSDLGIIQYQIDRLVATRLGNRLHNQVAFVCCSHRGPALLSWLLFNWHSVAFLHLHQ